jgi:hypothetical protein
MTNALIVAGLGIGVMLKLTHTGAMDPKDPAPALQPPAVIAAGSESAKLAELRREVVQLQRQVRTQGDQMASAAAAPIAQGEVQLAVELRDPQAELERREEDERRRLDYMVGVATAFRNEATDPTWAAATSSAVQAAIAEAGDFRQLAKSVECRSSTCRVEFTDDGSGKLASILPMFAMRVGQELPSANVSRVQDASGAATMVLYMSRHSYAVVSR